MPITSWPSRANARWAWVPCPQPASSTLSGPSDVERWEASCRRTSSWRTRSRTMPIPDSHASIPASNRPSGGAGPDMTQDASGATAMPPCGARRGTPDQAGTVPRSSQRLPAGS